MDIPQRLQQSPTMVAYVAEAHLALVQEMEQNLQKLRQVIHESQLLAEKIQLALQQTQSEAAGGQQGQRGKR